MVMKQMKIMKAYQATEKIADKASLDEKTFWDLYRLRQTLRKNREYQEERESQIRKKYLPYADENGVIRGEMYSKYLDEMRALGELEVDLGEITRIDIPFSKDLGLSVHDAEALEEFVNFSQDFVCKTGE